MAGFNIINKVVTLLTKPTAFFKEMPKTGGYKEPLIFVAIMGLIAGIITGIMGIVGVNSGGVEASGGGLVSTAITVIIMPIIIAIFSFIGAGILFLIWKLMGSTENYETAYRCFAYICVFIPIAFIVAIIPYIGDVVMTSVEMYYLVLASVNVHNVETKKAWLVFGIIGVLLVLMGINTQMKKDKIKAEANTYLNQPEVKKQIEEMQKNNPQDHIYATDKQGKRYLIK